MPFDPVHDAGQAARTIANYETLGAFGYVYDNARQVWNGVTDAAGLIAFVTDPRHLIRVGEVMAGAVCIGVGLYFLFASTETGAQVIETTSKAAGAAAKGAVAA